MVRTHSELIKLPSFEERFEYLKLNGVVCDTTFGVQRYVNQKFYRSRQWLDIRRKVIVRDMGCDLGMKDYDIHGKIIVHHMNPITIDDINNLTNYLLNPEYLICTCLNTHNSIHYSNDSPDMLIERTKNDMCPWKM